MQSSKQAISLYVGSVTVGSMGVSAVTTLAILVSENVAVFVVVIISVGA